MRALCRRIYSFIMHRGLYKCTGYTRIRVRFNIVGKVENIRYIPREMVLLMRRAFARNGLGFKCVSDHALLYTYIYVPTRPI